MKKCEKALYEKILACPASSRLSSARVKSKEALRAGRSHGFGELLDDPEHIWFAPYKYGVK